mmetsp:Transcript_20745/g.84313  ORF Transcript_20745/g.84313 Transcript_20745/m.84313 type:complete len:380 (-) Transcript_20745:7191-8330(-)
MVGFISGLSSVPKRGGAVRTNVAGERTERMQRVEEKKKARRDISHVRVPAFDKTLRDLELGQLKRNRVSTLQINIGLTCNQACSHCHVESSPSSKETMPKIVADRLVKLTQAENDISTVDITGGAPEMHQQFRPLVLKFREMGLNVIDRCNLTILEQIPDAANFLAENQVKVVASLPCYTSDNVEAQRGDGVFDSSIAGLQQLNSLGYGIPGSGLELDLVYNPGGAFLPPEQARLEEDYRRELKRAFGIQFTSLITIANMPIKRFADDLRRSNKLEEYLNLLLSKFNPSTVDKVMCVNQIHVAWDGQLYDCDFNYALEMPVRMPSGQSSEERPEFLPNGMTVFDIEKWSDLENMRVRTAKHCYACTAGTGSSCGGALTD